MTQPLPRDTLREQLKARRLEWLSGAEGLAASAGVTNLLLPLLQQLEPLCLGLYWPLQGEFDAPTYVLPLPKELTDVQLALPYAERAPRAMHYRRWDGQTPSARDGMGLPASGAEPIEPDVVLVPCLGFTREGYRLGYGGGFFDRWLAANPGVTAVGIAWSVGECALAVEPHDQALGIVLTERELIAP